MPYRYIKPYGNKLRPSHSPVTPSLALAIPMREASSGHLPTVEPLSLPCCCHLARSTLHSVTVPDCVKYLLYCQLGHHWVCDHQGSLRGRDGTSHALCA